MVRPSVPGRTRAYKHAQKPRLATPRIGAIGNAARIPVSFVNLAKSARARRVIALAERHEVAAKLGSARIYETSRRAIDVLGGT